MREGLAIATASWLSASSFVRGQPKNEAYGLKLMDSRFSTVAATAAQKPMTNARRAPGGGPSIAGLGSAGEAVRAARTLSPGSARRASPLSGVGGEP